MDRGSPLRSWALLQWRMRVPFVRQWALGASEHGDILEFWIRASEYDPWSFQELRRLLDALLDAGEAPDALERWGLEFAAERRKPPARRGPRTDYRKDFLTAFEVLWREADGESLNGVYASIAEREPRSPSTVRSAHERSKIDPRGL